MTISSQFVETAISANGGIASIWCEDLNTIGLSMSTSSLSGHTVAFEVSNNADIDPNTNLPVAGSGTWYSVQGQRTNAVTTETGATSLAATPAYGWLIPVSGWRFFRVRATAHTSGSALWVLFAELNAGALVPNTGTVTVSGTVTINAIPAGTNLIGDVGGQVRATTGGISTISRLPSAAATTNATSVKVSAGRVYKIQGYNAAAAVRYLKLYNKASAPTVGADTPVVTLALKASDMFDLDLGVIGQYFATGIAYALTTGAADSDTGALTSADIVGLNLWYA